MSLETVLALAMEGAPNAFKALVKAIADLGNRNTNALLEAMEVDRRSHHAQVAQHVRVLMVEWARAAKDVEELQAQVEAMAADSQFHRLHANLEYEAVRSTLDERKKMLAAAAAGLCDPTMSINEKARIERTLRELDPDDVTLLRANLTIRTGEHEMSVIALTKTGCIVEGSDDPLAVRRSILHDDGDAFIDEAIGRPYKKTPLGKAVLSVLTSYAPSGEGDD